MAEQTNQKKQKLIIALLFFFIAVGAAGGGWYWYYTSRFVSTDDARVSGTIVSVSSKVTGKVGEVLVAEGDRVKAGQVVARIDPRDIQAQQTQAEANLAAAMAKYEELTAGSRPQEIQQAQAMADQAAANLENAAKNYERMEKLYADGAISASARDNARTAWQVAREAAKAASQTLDLTMAGARAETIRAAAAQVKQAEAALQAVRLVDGETSVVSPVDGVVALKSVNAGEVVAAGQPLLSVVSTKELWVNARIEETYIHKLQLGQTVDYSIDGYPGRTFSGKVYEIGNAATSVFALIPTENSSNTYTKVTQRIPIKISLPENGDVVFRPGMSVVIKVHV